MKFSFGILVVAMASIAASQLFPSKMNLAESVAIRIAEARLQQELRLSPAQVETVNKVVRDYSAKQKSINDQMAKAKPAQADSLNRQMVVLEVATAKQILGGLSAEQKGRLWELAIQDTGPFALRSPIVAKKVGITPAQAQSIESIASKTIAEMNLLSEQFGKQIEAVPPGAAGNARRDAIAKSFALKSQQIEQKGGSAVLATLSKVQRTKWEAAKGKPFRL